MNVIPPKNPALPLPPSEYTPRYLNQLLLTLRLYFNQLDNAHSQEINNITTLQTDWYYGDFADSTTQTLTAINTPKAVTFNTTVDSYGVTVGTPTSRIVCANAARYNFQFSLQLKSSSSHTKDIFIWPRVNGVDVPSSATKITISSNSAYVVPAWNFILPMNAGDYFELMWAADDTAVSIIAETATAFCPAIPSIILTVARVNQQE